VSELLDLSNDKNIAVKQNILDAIDNGILNYKKSWIDSYKKVIASIEPELKEMWWYSENWLDINISSFSERFDKAFNRWRSLYASAKTMILKSRIVLDDPVIKSDSDQKIEAKRQHAVGLKQIELLKNDTKNSYKDQSE